MPDGESLNGSFMLLTYRSLVTFGHLILVSLVCALCWVLLLCLWYMMEKIYQSQIAVCCMIAWTILSNSVVWISCCLNFLRVITVSCVNWFGNIHPYGDAPSRTDWIDFDINFGSVEPIRQHLYCMSPEKQKSLDSEVANILQKKTSVPLLSSWLPLAFWFQNRIKLQVSVQIWEKVNLVTKPDSFPLPPMDNCIDQVGSMKFMSKFDLLKGYWQVPLSKRAQEIAVFVTPSGFYWYAVKPFGLRNAPATFQRLINCVVAGLESFSVYLDDLVIYSVT